MMGAMAAAVALAVLATVTSAYLQLTGAWSGPYDALITFVLLPALIVQPASRLPLIPGLPRPPLSRSRF